MSEFRYFCENCDDEIDEGEFDHFDGLCETCADVLDAYKSNVGPAWEGED